MPTAIKAVGGAVDGLWEGAVQVVAGVGDDVGGGFDRGRVGADGMAAGLPLAPAAVEEADVGVAVAGEGPPGATGEGAGDVVGDDGVAGADAEGSDGLGELVGRADVGRVAGGAEGAVGEQQGAGSDPLGTARADGWSRGADATPPPPPSDRARGPGQVRARRAHARSTAPSSSTH